MTGANQKILPVFALAKRNDIGQLFLREAHRSKHIRSLVAKALLRPAPFFPREPNLPVRELITMLRVALLAPSDLGRFPASEKHCEWYTYARNVSLWCLSQRLLMPKDVGTARRVLLAFQPFLPPEVISQAKADLATLEKKYEARVGVLKTAQRQGDGQMKLAATVELKKLRRAPRPRRGGGKPVTARGGRPISEDHQRRVAIFLFLKECGEKAPEKEIVALLREQHVETSTSKIREAVEIYQRAEKTHLRPDALISPGELPEFWLERLGWFFQYWIRQRTAPTETYGRLGALLQRFVDEFVGGTTPAVTSPPWRSPGSL